MQKDEETLQHLVETCGETEKGIHGKDEILFERQQRKKIENT